ncbi:MAG: ABC-F family ATP-binding cassette domain-containing protein [Clostridia bacterium]|jgi:ATP-binding cassette subfamily F protein 3
MIVLSLQHIEKSYGVQKVLEDISFIVREKQHLGLVGSNGAGKSTLFKIIAGELPADKGQVFYGKDTTLGYLPQEKAIDSQLTIWEELLRVFQPVLDMEMRLRDMEKEMGYLHEQDPQAYEKLLKEYSHLSDLFEKMGGYSYRSSILGVLTGLGFSREQIDQPIYQLSGGQKTRIALAKLLLQKPDPLLLDEPTNHLDLEAIQWLEGYLSSYDGAIIVISHDRYFLDHVCDSIADLENMKITVYAGNYTAFQAKKRARMEDLTKQYELQQEEIKRQKAIIERYRSFNREKSIRAAESREKALNRMELVERPFQEQQISFSFDIRQKSGKDVLQVTDLSKSFDGQPLFRNVSFSLRAGDRVALLGPNGVGKTTLFRILLQRIPWNEGDIKYGSNVQIGYYDQEQADLSPEKTVLEEVWDAHSRLTQTEVRNALAAFLFQGDDVFRPISTLSGGEKGRVSLVKLMLARDNFLLLDEPTNHLDIQSKEKLEEALQDYPGTILAISHDRYFINKIANRVFILTKDGIQEYLGNYDDYLEKLKQRQTSEETDETVKTKTAIKEERRKEREERQQRKQIRERIQALEASIAQTEAAIAELEEEMCKPEVFSNPDTSQKIQAEYRQKQNDLEELYREWEKALEEYEEPVS